MKKTRLSITLISLLTLMPILSNAKTTTELTSNEMVQRLQEQQSGGKSAISKRVRLSDSKIKNAKADDYQDAIIANYIFEYNIESKAPIKGKLARILKDNEGIWSKEQEKLNRIEAKKRAQLQKEIEKNKRFYTRGYCSFMNTVDVSEMVSFAEVECVLDGIGHAILTLNIHPLHSAKALVAKPVQIIMDNNEETRFEVKEGVVLNGLRTGLNIASIVNDRKIERMLAAGMLSTNTIVAEESLKYMDALEASKQKENSQVVPGTGGSAPIVIQNKNTEAPNMSDYLTITGIRMASSLVGIIGESMVNDLPYLYRIEKGQRIYFDGVVEKGVPRYSDGPIDYKNKSLINKSIQSISVDKKGNITFDKSAKQTDDTDDLKIIENQSNSDRK